MRFALAALAGLIVAFGPARAVADERIVVAADRDDDDADGVPDAEEAVAPAAPELVAVKLARARAVVPIVSGDAVRLLQGLKPVSKGATVLPGARLALQGLRGGRAEIAFGDAVLKVGVIEVHAVDGEDREVSLARSHASMERTPPERLVDSLGRGAHDPDALRFVIAGLDDDLPATVTIASFAESGEPIDAQPDVALVASPCPKSVAPGLSCGSTPPIRAVPDDIDRNHPLTDKRSIKAQLGGAIAVLGPRGDKLSMIRVGGPRMPGESERVASDPLARAHGRLRGRLKVILVRAVAHGPPPFGTDDGAALALARAEVDRANAMWAACGISFGPIRDLDIEVVDPPRPHLLAIGCDHGLPASGGALRFRADGRELSVKIAKGMRPDAAARLVAGAVRNAGLVAHVSDNVVMSAGAFGTSDVLVRHPNGTLALVEPPQAGPTSTDPTLTACVGRVDLDDGLQHFGDIDAISGTVEERALIKAFDDVDAGTLRVIMIPAFAGGGRIGESFIRADSGAIRNVVIEDRAGIRADKSSYALAHEIGHVLLDDPNHPDDFGIDTPTRLMDADAANPSAYGPRRLLVEECARVLRQAGPASPAPLLRPWPLRPFRVRPPEARPTQKM